MALRLVLLALLLLGVGVVHTLSHAGAHGGVSTSEAVQHSPQSYAAFDEAPVGADDPHAPSPVVVEQEDPHHRAHAEGTTASDCFALIPDGSELAPTPCPTPWCGAVGVGALRFAPVPDFGDGPGLSQLSVLRI
ncbi:hypothetical protein AB0O76_17525 [Streptomyces sp. NPDC086554]|uniref:hypothetical protein n=1 Tax=Streptomyces sp. NPDC086554 TaxID=3154864 RepID=UPI003413B798